MVLHRRLDYGFNGYQVPVVPRASRSARGRVPIKKKFDDQRKRAFEILATVAGKLLLESEGSGCFDSSHGKDQDNRVKNNNKWETEDPGRLSNADPCEKERCDEKPFTCLPRMKGHHQSCTLNEGSHVPDNFGFDISFNSGNAQGSEKASFVEKSAAVNGRRACGSRSCKVGGDSIHGVECATSLSTPVTKRKIEAESSIIRNVKTGNVPFRGTLNDKMVLAREPPALVCSQSNVITPSFRGFIPPGPASWQDDTVKVVCRDDDENSIGCTSTHPSTMLKAYRPLPDIIDRRIRNLSASRCWRVAPNLFRTDKKANPIYHKVKTCYARQRSQRIFSFKRKKFLDRSPLSKSSGRFCCEGIFNSPDKRSNGDNCGAALGGSSSVASQQAPPRSGDCNVKLSIKAFKVPELFIEIPVTATVGSLKRTVMEAVTAILGDELHVGVFLQGKMVRDDSKTLLQTGISQDNKHHSLGFMLEPRHAQIMPPECTEDPPLLPGGTSQQHTKQTASPVLQPGSSNVSQVSPVMNLSSCVETNLGVVPPLVDTSADNAMPKSQALVSVPAISMEALAMFALHQKPGHSEFVQRRIRRPFSVSEVEALVQAVEELGTGRWRDVKLRAFENANHRTYVDLKDKWKTLVHTARISPQQRRGEPVPQELLDRVLAAHSYWSQQQDKHQLKGTGLQLCL
ncbi:hypothetical protein CFOL_v3_20050 [Cephalotus follicularis]|uniref:Myb_DNA-binding domain-containing protein n=1 Tax=Cephalotus follicularis TaxID=3775 RepID=A0A1Q3C8H0_CEPFO|nr:hypothetical protein CFOL_v3_20050 [Cephalotus follicularis]